MRKFAFLVVCSVASAASLLPATPAGAILQLNPQETEFVQSINDVRVANGVAPLVVDEALSLNAQHWAQVQADQRRLSHQLLSLVMLDTHARAENVAFGHSVPMMQNRLLASARHRDTMLDPRYNRLGVGVRSTATGGMFVTQGFGAR